MKDTNVISLSISIYRWINIISELLIYMGVIQATVKTRGPQFCSFCKSGNQYLFLAQPLTHWTFERRQQRIQ